MSQPSTSTTNLLTEAAFCEAEFAVFSRKLSTPNYGFDGGQFNSFTDVSYSRLVGKHALVFGGSAIYDRFREDSAGVLSPRNETRSYGGVFVQDTVDLTSRFSLEAGFRLDRAKDYGTFALPQFRVLSVYRQFHNPARFRTRL
ncbi:MAG: TonB-dependent receptor [Acidobacteria bacterium]|nr:TonB-dependent receptor [Acidobacteriota bacterium]